MMRPLCILAVLANLSACGIDGEPEQPAGGVSVSLDSAEQELGDSIGLDSDSVASGEGF